MANALLLPRLSGFIAILRWMLDEFFNPPHSAGVFENLYGLSGWGSAAFMVIGAVKMVALIGFLVGFMRTWAYGIILAIHGISTLSTWKQLLNPYDGSNLLFFAALPMLAACLALFRLFEFE